MFASDIAHIGSAFVLADALHERSKFVAQVNNGADARSDIGRSLVFDRNIGFLSGGAREEEESEGYRLISNGIAF